MYKKLVSNKEHRRLLRESGLPESIADVYPPSQERLERMYPHLKISEAEKEVRRVVNEVYPQVL